MRRTWRTIQASQPEKAIATGAAGRNTAAAIQSPIKGIQRLKAALNLCGVDFTPGE